MQKENEKIILTVKTAKSTFCIIKGLSVFKAKLADGETKECDSVLKAWDAIDKFVRKLLAPKRREHGTYGRVLLTDDELERLYQDLGEDEANRCINYVDESAEANGNKNGWKNWNLVVRKCHREGWHKTRYNRTEETNTDSSYDMSEFKRRADVLPVYPQ